MSEAEAPLDQSEFQIKPEVVFNVEGLVAYRFIPPSTKEDDVESSSLVIFTGIEPPNKQYPVDKFGYKQFKAPRGHLPIFVFTGTHNEIEKSVINADGGFRMVNQGNNDSSVVTSVIPWREILEGKINLYVNASYVKADLSEVSIAQLIPVITDNGIRLKLMDHQEAPSTLGNVFNINGYLVRTDVEFMISCGSTLETLRGALSNFEVALFSPIPGENRREETYHRVKK